jgi:hypothetical protein
MPRRQNGSGFEDLVGALKRSGACADHPPLARSTSPADAAQWWARLQRCSPYMRRDHLRWFGQHDLFFLLVYLLNRRHFLADERKQRWTFARCNEVQDSPNNHLDLWHREGFKSEIITFGLTIQDVLNDPEITFGFFSHTRPMSKDFLVLIKREFEFNALLKEVYDDILWQDPKPECRAASVSWSENEGITVKRRGNPKEATIEAWGLVDGQPTGKRYRRLVYDDVVSRDSISPLMIQLTSEQFDNSLLLTAADPPIFRYIGTFQEFGDTTAKLIERGVGQLRLHSALDADRKPACLSDEKFSFFKQTLSPKVFALQILLDPTQAKDPTEVGFNHDWIEYWDPREDSLNGMNRYVLVDPAGNNPDSNSHFAMWTVALGADKRVRVLDIVCDKLDLEERWEAVLGVVSKYDPLKVGYEKYAMQADIEHFKYRMRELNQLFTIVQLGGGFSKDGRIGWLIPPFRDHRILFPREGIQKTLRDGRKVDMVREFLDNEYLVWPFNPQRRDLLDALSRLFDPALNVVWPRRYGLSSGEYGSSGSFGGNVDSSSGSWMSG